MNAELLNKLKHLANIAAHLPYDVTLEDEDAAMKALHGELAADTVLQMIALAERALLAAAPAPIQPGQLVEVGQMIEFDDHEDPRFHTIMCDWDNEARAKLTAGTKIYAASTGSQVQAAGDAGKVQAIKAAVSAIYFDDSSDYKTALWEVVQALDSAMAKLLEENPSAAYSQADAAAMREQP